MSGGVDTSAATGASSACLPPPGLCSSGLCELRWLYCAKNKMSRDCLYSCQHFHLKGLIPLDFLGDWMKVLIPFPGPSTLELYLIFLVVFFKKDRRNGYVRSRKSAFPSLKMLCKNCDLAARRPGLTWKLHMETHRKEPTSPLSLS